MGKLFKLQVKENLKTLIWVWTVPLVLLLSFLLINKTIDNTLTQLGIAISGFLVFFGIGVSGLIVIYKDYDRFFGKEDIFYHSLPVSPRANIWSRFFAQLISYIIIFFVMVIDVYLIALTDKQTPFSELVDLTRSFFNALALNPKEYFTFGLMILAVVVCFIFMIILSINLGSQKAFRSMGIFGPILTYILLTLAVQAISVVVLKVVPIEEIFNINVSGSSDLISFAEFMTTYKNETIFFIGVNVVISAIYGLLGKFSIDKRLSVG